MNNNNLHEDMSLEGLLFFSPEIKAWQAKNPRHAWALDQQDYSTRNDYYRTIAKFGYVPGAVMEWLWNEAARIEESNRNG